MQTNVKIKMKRGRPNRRDASERALAGLDVTATDPQLVLKTIASDASAPAAARVSAARALAKLNLRSTNGDAFSSIRDGVATERALKILTQNASVEQGSIPCCELYRGVRIHDQQSVKRRSLVRSQLDKVYQTWDYQELVQIIKTAAIAPEARLLAGAKIKAGMQIVAEKREVRPDVDLSYVEACICALDSQYWKDPNFFTSLLEPFEGAVRRESAVETSE